MLGADKMEDATLAGALVQLCETTHVWEVMGSLYWQDIFYIYFL